MDLIQVNKFAEIAHQNNIDKGFNLDIPYDDYITLVISELCEAIEADRKGKRAKMDAFEFLNEGIFESAFRVYIKDTVEDELADAIIRLLSISKKFNINAYCDNTRPMIWSNSFLSNITTLIDGIILRDDLSVMIIKIESLCLYMGFDVWKYVELKLEYNKTREYKHGKKY